MALLIVLCASAKTIYSQPTVSSTRTEQDEEIRRRQLVSALERAQTEVKVSRRFISELEESLRSKQKLVDSLREKDSANSEVINRLTTEISLLKNALSEQQKALKTRETEVEFLKKELTAARKKLSRARSLQKYLIVGAATAILIAIFK